MRSLFAGVVLALTLIASTAQHANAGLITYEFSGIGSGKIGATSFTDALVVFTGTAQTGAVQEIHPDEAPPDLEVWVVALDSLVVNIEGVGSATLTEPAELFGVPQAILDADDLPPLPLVILGRIDHPPALGSFTGMAGVGSNALAGYNLKTSIGPVSDFGGVGFIEHCSEDFHDPCLATSLGLLSFTTNIEAEGGGSFTATQAVPEPASLALVGASLAAFARRRARRS